MCLRSGAGFPDVLVVDSDAADAKLTSDVFAPSQSAWARVSSSAHWQRTIVGTCIIVGSLAAYHKNTNAKVERALAEFAINNAASALVDDLTPFFIDRGAHPRLSLSPPHDDRATGESPTLYAQQMRAMESTVLELLAAAQAERQAKLDAGRVHTVFQVGDRVLLRTKELLDAADIGKLRPRWDGPFVVTACPSPNAYTLALPRKMRCSPTINVDRLKPFTDSSPSLLHYSSPSLRDIAGSRAGLRHGAGRRARDYLAQAT